MDMVVLDIFAIKELSEKKRVKKELVGPGCPIETYKMELDVFYLLPGQEREPQMRPFSDRLFYVVEGEGIYKNFIEERPVHAGCITFAAAQTENSFRNTGDKEMIVLQFVAPSPEVGPADPKEMYY
jgi:mannose-6-phosphate isomerase-like protein (cupin superfamily)